MRFVNMYITLYALFIVVTLLVLRIFQGSCPYCDRNKDFMCKSPTTFNISTRLTRHDRRIDPHRYHYLLNEDAKCRGKRVDLLIVVQTSAGNFEQRDAIRETFGNKRHLDAYNAVMVFFVGISKKKSIMTNIRRESRLHGDIVQENYMDTRFNLTLKAVSWLKWIAEFCSKAENVIEMDDDVFANIPAIANWVKTEMSKIFRNTPYFAACIVYDYMAPTRRLSSRYYLSVDDFTFNKFSPFCDGAGFLLSRAAILAMYEACQGSEYMWIEDLYQCQVLGQKIGLYMHDIATLIYKGRVKHLKLSVKDVQRYLFIYHRTFDEIRQMWDLIKTVQ